MVFCLYRYVKALGILFDPSTSTVELQSIAVTGPRTVEANWTLGGTLLLPWHPSIRRFHGAPSAATVLLVGLQGSAQLVRFELDAGARSATEEAAFQPQLTKGDTRLVVLYRSPESLSVISCLTSICAVRVAPRELPPCLSE
jgi:hypothetical protein